MAASATDKYKKTGSSTVTTLAAPGKALAATSITVGSTTNYPTTTGIIVGIRRVDAAGVLIAGTYTEWRATVTSGTTLAIESTPILGTDQVYAAGSTTQVFLPVSSYGFNELIDGLLSAGLTQAGGMGAIAPTSVTSATGTFTGDVSDNGTPLKTIRTETSFDFISSGGVWSGDAYASTRNASMTALVCYINGQRGTISAVTARSFTASRDTYVDILNSSGTFSLVYTEVTNNAASPALAANSVRLAIIVTGATNIASVGSVNQGEETKVLPIASSVAYSVTDSLGNLICPRDSQRKVLGYKQSVSTQNTTSTTVVAFTPLSCPVIVPAGRKIKITAGILNSNVSVVPRAIAIDVYDGAVGGTRVGRAQHTYATASFGDSVIVVTTFSPTVGSHTYNIGWFIGGGAGTLSASSSATEPDFVIVELV